eukprot:1055045-Rhodomonas_salina.8
MEDRIRQVLGFGCITRFLRQEQDFGWLCPCPEVTKTQLPCVIAAHGERMPLGRDKKRVP